MPPHNRSRRHPNDDAVSLLEEILEEEETADETLADLAGQTNEDALGDESGTEADSEEPESDDATGRN